MTFLTIYFALSGLFSLFCIWAGYRLYQNRKRLNQEYRDNRDLSLGYPSDDYIRDIPRSNRTEVLNNAALPLVGIIALNTNDQVDFLPDETSLEETQIEVPNVVPFRKSLTDVIEKETDTIRTDSITYTRLQDWSGDSSSSSYSSDSSGDSSSSYSSDSSGSSSSLD